MKGNPNINTFIFMLIIFIIKYVIWIELNRKMKSFRMILLKWSDKKKQQLSVCVWLGEREKRGCARTRWGGG